MTSDAMLDERGSMLPMTAGLVFVAFAVVALLLELSLLGAAYRDVATVADLASEAAASMIAHQGAYGSEIGIDARIAEDEAKRVGVLWGSGDEVITVDVEVRRVCVTIEDTYEPRTLAFIGVAALALRATGCAEPRSG